MDRKRLYNALNVGMFIFVEDEFQFNDTEGESKAHVLIDFARMDSKDRMTLLDTIPDGTPGKSELYDYAGKAESWVFTVDWANVPQDDVEFILKGRPDILELYQAVPETLWEGDLKQDFLRFGVGVVVQDIFKPLFREVIRSSHQYLPTRIYKAYVEEIRVQIMQDLARCKDLEKSAVLILDNKVSDARMATQMIYDLKQRDVEKCCPIYATIFSTATKDFSGESCETPEMYIGYANKSEEMDGVHKNIIKAAINLLIQRYKEKYKAVIDSNCDILAQNPDLVEYLYGMAKAEGEPGYELLQQWLSFMTNHDMEQSDEMVQLMKLSSSIDAYDAKINWNPSVPHDLIKAAQTENFSPTVNKFCTATAPGDIFEISGKLYVLVGQDCDYMMGEERDRNAPLCELVPAELVSQSDIGKLSDDEKYVYINNYADDSGKTYVLKVNYRTRKVICNEIINLCAFNQDGLCRIDCGSDLPEPVSALLQPYMLEYYKKLNAYFNQVRAVKEKFPDFYKTASELKITKPLVDISTYQEKDNVLDYGIKRVSRLKRTASLYLYKMFLEYRGRMPYTTVNLTGYSEVTVMVEGADKYYATTAHIKFTNNRKKNQNKKEQPRLAWYVRQNELQEAINSIFDGEYELEEKSEYIELLGKAEIELRCGSSIVALKKQVKNGEYTIRLNLKNNPNE